MLYCNIQPIVELGNSNNKTRGDTVAGEMKEINKILRKMERNDEFFEISARIKKKMYDALIKEGFNESQATQIVASQSLK